MWNNFQHNLFIFPLFPYLFWKEMDERVIHYPQWNCEKRDTIGYRKIDRSVSECISILSDYCREWKYERKNNAGKEGGAAFSLDQ